MQSPLAQVGRVEHQTVQVQTAVIPHSIQIRQQAVAQVVVPVEQVATVEAAVVGQIVPRVEQVPQGKAQTGAIPFRSAEAAVVVQVWRVRLEQLPKTAVQAAMVLPLIRHGAV